MTEPTPIVPVAIVAARRKGSGGATNLVLALAALVAVGGVAFAGGRATAPASSAENGTRGAFAGANGYGPTGSFTPGNLAGRGGTISGTVSAVDGSKLTITTTSGSTVVVDTASATYHTQTTASSSDVTTGATVQVSVAGGGFPGGPGTSAAPGASGASAATGTSTLTASDVTITTK
jgi:hypothetical protein